MLCQKNSRDAQPVMSSARPISIMNINGLAIDVIR